MGTLALREPTPRQLLEIQTRLLGWFRVCGRQLIWRETRDPYAVLLAEKLLQQTAVREGLVRAYVGLLTAYPTPAALARGDVDRIRTMIQPLGLHYRAAELVAIAQALCERHGGHVPRDLQSLLALPGVGDYTARAVLCYAFGEDVAVVDTNVARILHRVMGLSDPIPANPARNRNLIALARSLLPSGRSRDFNLAMLDLGALICKAAAPSCSDCPLSAVCRFRVSRSEQEAKNDRPDSQSL